ncbi:hypothetical protein AVEN_11575-1, partial [Araneus ventricosus]
YFRREVGRIRGISAVGVYGTPDTSRDDSDRRNATPHASRVAIKWLQEHSSDFRHFHWPPKSPEMNIIENIRDALLHVVEKRSPPCRTPMDLLTALQDSWCEKMPSDISQEAMPRRVAALLRACGGPTRY